MTDSSSSNSSTTIQNREQLVCVLRLAARLEHLLACQYLFAGFTLRKELTDFPTGGDDESKHLVIARNQRWGFKVMQIARQEMEHLGIVNNLLGAVGEPSFFNRPNYPVPRTYLPIGTPFVLQKFGRETLERFLAYERPDFLEVPDSWRGGGPPDHCIPSEGCGDLEFADVQVLYNEIGTAFSTLPPDQIFVGNSQRQVSTDDAPLSAGLGVTLDPVTNRESAATAIGLILEQGEGVGDYPLSPESHFGSFNTILQEYLDAIESSPYDPALPVVDNPLLEEHTPCSESGTIITDPYTRRVMKLFNDSYATMLRCLGMFFETFRGAFGNAGVVTSLEPLTELQLRTRNDALMETAFFPFMTMVIRPLGEFVARLPAFEGDAECYAGPSFELKDGKVPDIGPEELPAAIEALARECRAVAEAAPDEERGARITYIADNMSRMSENFSRVWNAVKI